MNKIWKGALAGALCSIGAFSSPAMAQNAYPDRPITIIVPFAAGGTSDILSRLFGQKLTEILGQDVIVDNRPGAASTLGTDILARSEPDGYTIQVISAIAHNTSAIMTPDVQYDPVESFTAIGGIGWAPYLLIANPDFGADYAEVIAKLKADPGKYDYASSGLGSAPHLVMEVFEREAGVELEHIPYGGGAPALNDVVAGTVPLIFENVAAIELLRAGQVRGLVITGQERSPLFPDVPTFTEVGLPSFDITAPWGVIGPAGIPDDVVAVLEGALEQAVADPEFVKVLNDYSITAEASTSEEFGAKIAEQAALWREVIEAAGLLP
ncbi:MAG: hypothetical protein ABS76_12410 [Pelagibacterium sp. SCN 64-44]|nr:MAG: hypothetical protein ABS76_12410 [Pelagibacterium sp. SCN 64-44]